MKSMKKIAALLAALLIVIQLVPVLGETYSSGMIVGSPEGYKEALDIVASKGTYVLLGQTLELDVNEDYQPEWKSDDESIATVDEKGVVTAVAEGTVTMTATVTKPQVQTATVEITVIDPEPIKAEPLEGDPETEQQPAEPETENQAPVSKEKKAMVIVINGENERITYDGEEHVLDHYVATSNEDYFDASKIRVEGEPGVKAINCGFYELKLEEAKFTYDDPDVAAHFVVNNSFLKITPATATVTPDALTKEEGGEDPALTATVTGLIGDDTLEYTLRRDAGEEPGHYRIYAEGGETQGNYRVEYAENILTITEKQVQEELNVWITSLYPADQPIYYGAEITLEAHVSGAAEGEYTIQWQYSEDLENWKDIPGANASRYTFLADGETVTYAWRAEVNRIQ